MYSFWKKLTDDIGCSKFSLLLGESNDISALKLLGVSTIYFSHASNKVESTYLALTQLEKCDSSRIVTALKKLLVTKYLNINNCIAI